MNSTLLVMTEQELAACRRLVARVESSDESRGRCYASEVCAELYGPSEFVFRCSRPSFGEPVPLERTARALNVRVSCANCLGGVLIALERSALT